MKRIIFALFILIAATAQAVTLTNLYSINMPIHSQVTWRRLEIMPRAMAKVLVKVSGNASVMKSTQLKAQVKAAKNYVSQYYYYNDKQTKQLMIHVGFVPSVVNKWLSQTGSAIWGATRPLTLMWLVDNDSGEWAAVNSSSDSKLEMLVNKGAVARGLPLILPIMDLIDMQKVSINDFVQGDWVAIQAASARYSPDAILLVSVDDSNQSQINSEWHLLIQGNEQSWSVAAPSMTQIINKGMNQLTMHLTKQYAINETASGKAQMIQLQLVNVNEMGDYAEAKHYLNSVTGVKQVTLSSLNGSKATFNIQFDGSVPAFVQQLNLGRKLLPASQNSGMLSNEKSLVYQLKGS